MTTIILPPEAIESETVSKTRRQKKRESQPRMTIDSLRFERIWKSVARKTIRTFGNWILFLSSERIGSNDEYHSTSR